MNLQQLIDEVAKRWKMDEEKYPDMEGLSQEKKKFFAMRHILWHQMKAMGKLAEMLEEYEHGRHISREEIVGITRKLVFNALRLAQVVGEKGDDLEWWITHPI